MGQINICKSEFKISVVVPVYKKPKYIQDICQKILANTYENKEILVAIDGIMSPEIQEAIESIKGKIQIFFPDKHLGKAEILNKAVEKLSTDVILFLDNDVVLPDDPDFVLKVSDKMKFYDIVEMAKEVIAESLFSAMIGYEYLSLAFANLAFSNLVGRTPGIIGSAFAVKKIFFDKLNGFRQVVHEDADFGARAFRLNVKYRYERKLKIKTAMPNNLSDWYKQRKRWTLNNVLWVKENFVHFFSNAFKQPSIFLTLIVILLPTIISVLLIIIFNKINLIFIVPVLFMIMQPVQFMAGILLWFTHYIVITKGIIATLLSLAITTLCYFFFSIYINFRFNFLEFLLFYFIYLPILIIINIVMFIIVLREKKINLDW